MSRFADPSTSALPGRGDRVVVAGVGISGVAAARALRALGATVRIADDRGDDGARAAAAALTDQPLTPLDPGLAGDADLIVVSPGIRPDVPLLDAARAAAVPVWSEIELGFRMTRVPVVAVTGTNGKTTTTEMTVAALRAAGIEATAAGNIGTPLTEAATGGAAAIVCEVSSFQLHHIVSFRPAVAVLLNIADDHLDWHGTFAAYTADKGRMFSQQTSEDAAIVHDDPVCREVAAGARARLVWFTAGDPPPGGAGIRDGWIVAPGIVGEAPVAAVDSLPYAGAALTDAIAAAAAACALGADPSRVGDGLAATHPGRHRTELVATVGGVAYIDDSKATNPHATRAALAGRSGVVLIAGGRNKGLDLSPIAGTDAVRAVVAIGEAAAQVEAAFAAHGVTVVRAGSMDAAVAAAAALARPGGTVLLSPACASFDWFRDYKDRGEAFRRAVESLFSATGEAAIVGETNGNGRSKGLQ